MDPVAWLLGEWSVDRAVNGQAHTFSGVARFVSDGAGGASWHETGHLVLDAYDGPASRTLAIVPEDGGYAVRFDDGRPFHALDLDGPEAEHLCGPDVYRGVYRRSGEDGLDVTWRVSGPGRADVIESRYSRI